MRQSLPLLLLAFVLGWGLLHAGVAVAQSPDGSEDVSAAASTEPADAPPLTPRPDAPQMELDLSTPRATLLDTFFPAINRINRTEGDQELAWQHVLATLQWEGVVSEPQARTAAMQLLEVFDKLGEVTPPQLPGENELEGANIHRFVFFPQPDHHAWVWDMLERFNRWPEGQIVLVRTDAGWQFSALTVTNIHELAESMAPLPPRHLAPQLEAPAPPRLVVNLLGPTFQRTPWWGWLGLLGMIFLGLLAGKLVSSALRGAANRLRQRHWQARALALEDAAGPASLALLGLGLAIGLEWLVLTDDLETLRRQVLLFLYLFALGWFLYNLVNLIEVSLERAVKRTGGKLDQMLVLLIRRALRIFLVVMFTLVVAENVFGLNVTAWIAGFGIVGLAISLAAQDSIRNLFGSVTIFLDNPFKVGDFIEFDGSSGVVESIGFRSTRMRLLTGHVLTIPNARFIDSNVENITARPSIRRLMSVAIPYNTPTEKLEQAVQIVKDVLHNDEVIHEGRFDMTNTPPRVALDTLNPDNLNITVMYWYQMAGDPTRGWFTYMDHCQMVNVKLIRAFREAGINFALPTRTLHLAGDKNRQLAVRLLNADGEE